MLKKLIRLNADDLLLCAGGVGGVFLLLHLVTAIVLKVSGEHSSILVSGVILPFVAGIVILITSLSHTALTFEQALRFSQTRRRALGLSLGVMGFEALFTMGLAALLSALEASLAPCFWLVLTGCTALAEGTPPPLPEGSAGVSAASTLFVERMALPWWAFPLIALGAVILGLLMGAVLQRFGPRSLWAIWAAWMLVCFLPQLLPWKQYTIVDWLFPLIGLTALAALLWSIHSLLHASVRN